MTQRRHTDARHAAPAPRARQAAPPIRESDPLQSQRAVADPSHASADALLTLQRSYGNRAVTQLVSRPPAPLGQTSLTVGAAGDAFEREAGQVADRVMRSGVDRAGPAPEGWSLPGDDQAVRSQTVMPRKSNKPQTVVKQHSGPLIQLSRKSQRARKRAAKHSSTNKSSTTPLLLGDGRDKVKPSMSSVKEETTPTTAPEDTSPKTPTGSEKETTSDSPTQTPYLEGNVVAEKIGVGSDLLNDIVDIKDAYSEYQKSGSKGETVGAIAKGGGKTVSAGQNLALLTGYAEKDSPNLMYSTAISQGAAIIAAGTESYKAFNEMRDNWEGGMTEVWTNKSRIGAVIEKVMDGLKGVADLTKTFFEKYKTLEIPMLDIIKQASVIVQKVQSFWSAWTRWAKIKAQGANVTRQNKKEVVDHLINLTWDQMKQNAWEILAAGVNLSAATVKGTGVGMIYGYLLELGGKIAEGGGKAYVSGLRYARESSYTSDWMFDKHKTAEARKKVAEKIAKFNQNYLYEAAGLTPPVLGTLQEKQDKVEEALAQPN